MTPREAADRLLRAEAEYRAALLEHNGTMRATVRYQAARREMDIAFAVARAVLENYQRATHAQRSRSIATRASTARHESRRHRD